MELFWPFFLKIDYDPFYPWLSIFYSKDSSLEECLGSFYCLTKLWYIYDTGGKPNQIILESTWSKCPSISSVEN